MSSDFAALSDDDRLLVLKTAPNGRHQGASSNGNAGRRNPNNEDYLVSEDDDLPLVR
jgi:hypothetical protein